MRKYIGQITSYIGTRARETPEREKMRIALIRKYRTAHAEKEADKHFDEMMGKREMSKFILVFFDEEGNPPANLSIESITRQYRLLSGQMKWLAVIFHELHGKLENIDPERYERDQIKRRQKEHELEASRELSYKKYLERRECDGRREDLLKLVHSVIRDGRHIWELRKYSEGRNIMDMRIVGVRHVEAALRCMLAGYVANPALAVPDDVDTQYLIMKEQADWIEVTIAEIESKLLTLREMTASGLSYLDEEL